MPIAYAVDVLLTFRFNFFVYIHESVEKNIL